MHESVFSKIVQPSKINYMFPDAAVYVDERTRISYTASFVFRYNVASGKIKRLCPNTPTLVQRAAGHVSDNGNWLVLYHGGIYVDRVRIEEVGN